MRSFTILLLSVPSFVQATHAQDAPSLDAKYKMLAVQMSCARECDMHFLQNQASEMGIMTARRQFSSCRMKCSDDYNKTSSILPARKAPSPE